MPACSAARAAAAAATRHRCAAQATGGLGRQAGRGEDREQPSGTHVAVGATRRCVGIGHGTTLVEDGVTGRTAEFVNGHVVDLRCGSLREHPVKASSSPHCLHLHLCAGAPRRPAVSLFRSAGRGSAGVVPGAGAMREELPVASPPRHAALGGGRWRWSEWGWGGCSFWFLRRLWKPQSRRPLSWVVSPPAAQGSMWSPWQFSAGS
jgi:hypothetical protein